MSNFFYTRFTPGSPVVLSRGNTSYSTSLNHESIFMNCSVYNSLNITWYLGKNRVRQGPKYSIYRGYGSGTNLSVLKVMGADCQVAGNYTCVAVNKYGSDQRQFTLTILGKQPVRGGGGGYLHIKVTGEGCLCRIVIAGFLVSLYNRLFRAKRQYW